MSYKEVVNMNIHDFNVIIKSLNILEARENLDALTINSYPHSDKNHRKKTHRYYSKRANPEPEVALKTNELILF